MTEAALAGMSVDAPVRQRKALYITKLYADGRKRNLGIVSFESPNNLKHWLVNTYIKLKERFRGEI